jgi:3-methylcrotonyl-CoA carboxylase alpha subunit
MERRMIPSLLIANRGEIARRIIRTARRLGIRTVAVHSDVDAAMPFVREADAAVCIGPAAAHESYLGGEKILAAARETGAAAIHPGYGFLSENAEFAEAVIAAGVVWVGAPPSAIRAMGLKDAAKRLMQQAGVPTTPGYLGDNQTPGRLQAEADAIGYPVLIKAVAGGGGKGMRRVDDPAAFADALASCQREAAASFGDDRVLIEKYILSPRHIEVQVFGDAHGNVVHLFERDCSLQRRHQKVIEEAPAPGMDADTRRAMGEQAVKLAKAVQYQSAGTVEFVVGRDKSFYFLEMNTRLQVEHPVTELITGLDLVEQMIRVAAGEPLTFDQADVKLDGWAMEARICAEDPARGFLPSVGRLVKYRPPVQTQSATHAVRVDTGVYEGGEVSMHYDSMIAKLIATHPPGVEVWPVRTNAGFLARAAGHPDFAAGKVDTGFIERHGAALLPPSAPPAEVIAAAAQALRDEQPLALRGFRLNAPSDRRVAVDVAGNASFTEAAPHPRARTATVDGQRVLFVDGDAWPFAIPSADRAGGGGAASDGAILAPMPGRIVAVNVAEGERVTKSQKLLTLEAMKMEQALLAPFDGVVTMLAAVAGGQVSEGTVLARVDSFPQS